MMTDNVDKLVEHTLAEDGAKVAPGTPTMPSVEDLRLVHALNIESNPLAHPQKIGNLQVYGLRKRELYAAMALQGMLSNPTIYDPTMPFPGDELECIVDRSIAVAEKLLQGLQATT
jgi:hypothetical protein